MLFFFVMKQSEKNTYAKYIIKVIYPCELKKNYITKKIIKDLNKPKICQESKNYITLFDFLSINQARTSIKDHMIYTAIRIRHQHQNSEQASFTFTPLANKALSTLYSF